MRFLTPSFGAYAAHSAQLSGAFRHTHSRIVEFAEEIAFFGGENTEKLLLDREYASLVMHEKRVLGKRWWHGIVEEGIIKWLWGSYGVRHESTILLRDFPEVLRSWLFVRYLCSSRSRGLRISTSGQEQRVGYSLGSYTRSDHQNRFRDEQTAAAIRLGCFWTGHVLL